MTNLKIDRLAQDLFDALWFRLYNPLSNTVPVTQDLDATGDRYLTVTDGIGGLYQIVRFLTAEQTANNSINPVTGSAQSVFTPHVVQCGFNAGVKATTTVTLTGAVATKKVTIDTSALAGGAAVDFTAVAATPGANEFLVTGTNAQDAAAMAAAINASTTAGIAGYVYATSSPASNVVTIHSYVADETANGITVVSNDGSMVVSASPMAGATSAGACPSALRDLIMAEVVRKGPEVRVYQDPAQFALGDFVAAKMVSVYRNTEWGNLSHI